MGIQLIKLCYLVSSFSSSIFYEKNLTPKEWVKDQNSYFFFCFKP